MQERTAKYFFFIFLLLINIYFVNGQNSIPNSDFEDWNDNAPSSWDVSNLSYAGIINFVTVTQGSDNPQSGLSYAKLKTITQNIPFIGEITVPGVITLGEIIVDYENFTADITGGVPFIGRPDSIVGFIKSSPAQNDSCMIALGLAKWNGSTRDTIGLVLEYFAESSSDWTAFNIPIDYYVSDNPDSLNIIISSSALGEDVYLTNSELHLDNISFIYGSVGILDIDFSKNIIIGYNDVIKELVLHCRFEQEQNASVQLFSINGQLLFSNSFVLRNGTYNIPVNNLHAGMYILAVSSANTFFSQKIMVR